MTRTTTVLVAIFATLAFAPSGALANGPGHCPPGLAKKSPSCVPPGLAKKWNVGERFDGNSTVVRVSDYDRLGLPRTRRGEDWVRVGDVILKVDEETRLILDIIDVTARVFN